MGEEVLLCQMVTCGVVVHITVRAGMRSEPPISRPSSSASTTGAHSQTSTPRSTRSRTARRRSGSGTPGSTSEMRAWRAPTRSAISRASSMPVRPSPTTANRSQAGSPVSLARCSARVTRDRTSFMPEVLRLGFERSVRGGEVDGEARAGDADGAAVALGDGPHDREAEAGAGRRGVRAAPEPLERVLGLLGREAGALVGDADARAVAVALDRDRDRTASVAARIADEVADRALERRALAEDHDRVG